MSGYETRNSLDSYSDEGDSAPFAQLFRFILSSALKTSSSRSFMPVHGLPTYRYLSLVFPDLLSL